MPAFADADAFQTWLLGLLDRVPWAVWAEALVVLLVTLVLSGIAQRSTDKAMARWMPTVGPGARTLAGRSVRWGLVLIGVLTALDVLGVELTTLFTAGTVIFVGIGLTIQSIMQSLLAGVMLLAEREVAPGDVLDYDGTLCKVEHIGLRTCVLRTKLGETVIVPNWDLATGKVVNHSHTGQGYRVPTRVGVAYESDPEQVIAVLTEAAAGVDGRDQREAPVVLFEEFGDSALLFLVMVLVTDPWSEPSVRSHLNRRIHKALGEAGIVIAFPQLDVHLDGRLSRAEGQ